MNIGNHIKFLRQQRGSTQEQVAEAWGVFYQASLSPGKRSGNGQFIFSLEK